MAKQISRLTKTLRDRFHFATTDTTHYFPGHMAKGLKQIQRQLKDIDCIIEVHDARIPLTGRNPTFKETVIVRPHVLLMNKTDLADLSYRKPVDEYLRKAEGIENILYVNCKENINRTIKTKILPTVVDLVTSGPRYNREGVEGYRLLVIGIPNVGKSSLINAMRRIHTPPGKKRGKATKVGSEAGVTRSVLTEIKICESPRITVIDSPGILQPKITDVEVGMRLALCSNMKDHLVGEEMIADYLLFVLNKQCSFKYVEFYGLPEPTDDVLELLFSVAKERNLFNEQKSIISGGHQIFPKFNQAAKIVLADFRSGILGKINLDQEFTDKLSLPKEST